MFTVTCHKYNTWAEAHAAHTDDFAVYMFDVLPDDELCVPGICGYIGSAGANATREKETKTASKSSAYVKGSVGARYRGGSYTRNHTKPQQVEILTISRNIPQEGQTKKEFYKEANNPGYKSEEREFLGYLENRLHNFASTLGLNLANRETPKCINIFECALMNDREFFNHVKFEGDVPVLIKVAQGEISLDNVRTNQKRVRVDFARKLLENEN